jgi:hypothetical protein
MKHEMVAWPVERRGRLLGKRGRSHDQRHRQSNGIPNLHSLPPEIEIIIAQAAKGAPSIYKITLKYDMSAIESWLVLRS